MHLFRICTPPIPNSPTMTKQEVLYQEHDPEHFPPPSSEAEGLTLVKDWTEAEERAAKRK